MCQWNEYIYITSQQILYEQTGMFYRGPNKFVRRLYYNIRNRPLTVIRNRSWWKIILWKSNRLSKSLYCSLNDGNKKLSGKTLKKKKNYELVTTVINVFYTYQSIKKRFLTIDKGVISSSFYKSIFCFSFVSSWREHDLDFRRLSFTNAVRP